MCFCQTLMVAAQQYYFKRFLVEDGLAHNTVVTLMRDSKGMLWIGTRGGLNRFDGYTFKNFNNEHNTIGTLGNNIIISLAEDKKGMIWIGTEKGLFKYDPFRETFSEMPFFMSDGVDNIVVDEQNTLWFLRRQQLYYYDQKNKPVATKISATCFAFGPEHKIWTGTYDGIANCYDQQLHRVDSVRVIDNRIPRNFQLISKIYVAANHKILIGTTKKGLINYDTNTHQQKSILLLTPNNTEIYIRNIVASNKDEYWIATESGVYIYHQSSGIIRNLTKRFGDNYSISDNAVYSLCSDGNNGMWAGTFFSGLNHYSAENSKFEKYYPMPGANSISGNAIREITEDNQHNIWIGTEDAGISKFNLKTGLFNHYTSEGTPGSLSYPNIHGLLPVGNKLYVGPFQHGLEIMDMKTARITDRFKLLGEKGHMISDFVMCIYLTKDSTLLIGTTGTGAGLYRFDQRKKTFTKYKQLPGDSFVFSILEDHNGTIWTGSLQRGAFYFNPKTGEHGNMTFEDHQSNKQHQDYQIRGIFEDSNYCIWFMTEGGGLIRLSRDKKSYKKFTVQDGLPSNYMYRALEDNHKNLWISSLKGLIRFNLITEKISTYTQSNGLITDQFNYNSAFKDHTGRMYFGSVRGLISFDPDQLIKHEPAPPIYITGFQINNKEVIPDTLDSPLKRSVMYTDSIILSHDQSNFSIEFAALNYSSPSVTYYRFMMKGLDKDWTLLKSNRRAYFTDLAPGEYTFMVSAESNVGSWKTPMKKIFIRVLPPFWKSVPAYFVYFLLLVVSIYSAIFYYKQYLEKKHHRRLMLFEHEKEKEIFASKIEFFTNIAHEIQTPLTLIIGPVNLLKEKVKGIAAVKQNINMIEKNANRLLELTGQLLDFRKTEIDQFGLSFVNTDITVLLKEQFASFNLQAEKKGITLKLNMPRKHIVAFVDKEAFIKILGNLFSNAIKYTKSKVTIVAEIASPESTHFKISFSNDGAMIPKELRNKIFQPFFRINGNLAQGTGIGLALAKSLTELHDGVLILKSSDENETIFELSLPIHQRFEFTLKH